MGRIVMPLSPIQNAWGGHFDHFISTNSIDLEISRISSVALQPAGPAQDKTPQE
jgi:hypothetical protein